jgi:2-polyprenyl-3-methyl-5-hydroxy-6-metoxy-1,4-benzoquinol methylase
MIGKIPNSNKNISISWLYSELDHLLNCPVCGSTSSIILHEGVTDKIFFCTEQKWSILKCSNCGCGFLNPRPNKNTIHLAYLNYYTHLIPFQLNEFQLSFVNGYRNWRFNTDYQPANRLGILLFCLLIPLRQKIDKLMRGLPKYSSGKKLLDVGFGNGAFLELAKGAGWEVYGVDFDAIVVKSARARGFDVRLGDIDAFSDMPGYFDFITLSHVIEHVHDPRAVVKQINRLLKPGGRVWIETPNFESYSHQRFGSNWRGLEPPRHLVLFNWSALEELLMEEGFYELNRLPRHDVYRKLATLSRIIENPNNPNTGLFIKIYDSIVDLLRGVQSRFNYNRSEHITLIATKRL